ncbi:uncharacterized protein LOC134242600 isoform X2 [Saccostrea cucullata]|uniref:uncharacterized protein LOC134242600 isoform X2 n=1 Tax=Saccostrea cuccullata TaxID=36930 RepID=UPI002ED042D3
MKCCEKETMPEDRNPRNIRGRQIRQRLAKIAEQNVQHSKQVGHYNSTKPGVHMARKSSAPCLHQSAIERKPELYTIRDLNKSGNLRPRKQNQGHTSRFPNINEKDDTKPVYTRSMLPRFDKDFSDKTGDQYPKISDARDSMRPASTERNRHIKDNKQNQSTEIKGKNTHYHVVSRHTEKRQVHSFGTSAVLNKERVPEYSYNLKQDENLHHGEVSKGESIQKTDQPTHSTNESTVQGREPPKGLPNIGNTCYANSLLQVLGQTPFLYERLFSCKERVSTGFNQQMKTTVTSAFRNLLQSMKSETFELKSGPIAMLMNAVSSREREFRIGLQNDCHSFLLTLLSELYDENQAKDTTIVFEIDMVDEFSFDSCDHKEVTDTQIMRSLTIPSESYNVDEGLKTLLYEEEFDEADVPCRECKSDGFLSRTGKTRKAMRFRTLPKVLVLQLGCFQEMSYGGHLHIAKSFKRIAFPEKLRVPQSNGGTVTYHLYGVVNHHGSVYGGHYTSFVKHHSDTGHWYYCNDSHVRHSTLLEALKSHDAYLLFYTI